MRSAIATSALHGCTGMLGGALIGAVAVLPLRPADPVGFEELGWVLMTMLAAGVLALVGGAVGLHRGLRGTPHRGATVAAFLPLALLLGFFSAGAAALVAPPLARWLVELWAGRRPTRQPGWGQVSRG